jgi:hypothetical protein
MTRSTSELQKLRKDHPDVWIPVEVGDSLEGNVMDVDTAWSDARGDYYPLLVVLTRDNIELKWHAFETVADNQVMKLQPVPGEEIIITYKGEGAAKPGRNAPKLFTIRIPGRDPATAAANIYGQLQHRKSARPGLPTAPPNGAQTELPVDSPDDDPPY